MPNQRVPVAKRAAILAALSEGMPIRAVCRVFKTSTDSVSRIIRECGEALTDYMHRNFRELPCKRIALDEQWQYVGEHGQRMPKKERERGDFWLWAGIDSDTKLVFSFLIGKRTWRSGEDFVEDVSNRVTGQVQIATDPYRSYVMHIPAFFRGRGCSFGTEKKIFNDARAFNPEAYPEQRKNGVPKIVTTEREPVMGNPDLDTLTTCHIERFFLTMRQELKRYQRLGLGYSKSLEMHKLATALHIGIYNLVRRHISLDRQTPAQAAGIEFDRWTLEDVVALSDRFLKQKEDAAFLAAFAVREAA